MAKALAPTIQNLDFKLFLTKWRLFFRISNGWASRFQITLKIQTISNPTSFWYFKIQTDPYFRSPVYLETFKNGHVRFKCPVFGSPLYLICVFAVKRSSARIIKPKSCLLIDNKVFEWSLFVKFILVIVVHSFQVASFLGHQQDARMVPDPAQVLHIVKKTALLAA